MKINVLFFLLGFQTFMYGQAMNHFNHLDSKWNVAKTYPAGNPNSPSFTATTTTVYGFQGDTTINNKKWFKLYATKDSLFQKNLLFCGLTRTENNQVLYMDTLSHLNTLYDFNLTVGDSVFFNINSALPEALKVVKIDSIQINGAFYKRIKFAEPKIIAFTTLNELWVEGIGSIHGPLFPQFPKLFSNEVPGDSMLVTCTFSNNQPVWKHPSYKHCYANIVFGVNKTEASNFKIYPNPFFDKIYFEKSAAGNSALTISNTFGQIVRQLKIHSNNETIILTDLKPGFYFFTIDNGETTKTMKIIKEKSF